MLDCLREGIAIEEYLQGKPLPSLLVLGDGPLHVVVAYDTQEDAGYVITAYRPDLQHFEEDYKTRRSL